MQAIENNFSTVRSAVVLAGGLGTRLRQAVPDIPKPMAPVLGRPFLAHQLDYWINQGISEFILSVGYRHEVIMNYFGKSYHGATIHYAVEDEPLGTGGGLLLASRFLPNSDPFLVTNGDTFFEIALTDLKQIHGRTKARFTLSLFRTKEAHRYMSIQLAENGRVISVGNEVAAGSFLVNGGVYIVDPSVLTESGFSIGRKFSLEDDLIPNLISSRHELQGYECSGRFIDIGVPRDYFRVSELFKN